MFGNNIYDNPEKFGLEILAELKLDHEPYAFDLLVAWKDANGRILFAHDSGCSCPQPFEEIGVDDLLSLADRQAIVSLIFRKQNNRGESVEGPKPEDVDAFRRATRLYG